MLKIGTFKAFREAENKSGVVEGYLFNGYSKRKLYCLSETYEELARLYRDIPQAEKICADRRDMLYRQQIRETKEVFANHLDEISSAFADGGGHCSTREYTSRTQAQSADTLLKDRESWSGN